MNPFNYNGGVCVAMKGKNCVAIASDHRLGAGRVTVGTDFPKVFEMGPALFLGLPGLTTDSLTVVNKLKFRLNLYELRENRKIRPHTFKAMVESMLYERRFGPYYIAPVIAGLDPETDEPFVTAMDVLGAGEVNEPFAVAGTAEESLLGLCEALWEPDLAAEDLFETLSQVILNAVDFDCLAGAGATVHVIEKDKVTTRTIKTRMD